MCLANLIITLYTISALRSTQINSTCSSIELRQLQGKVTHDNRLKMLSPGAVKVIRDQRINRKWIKTSTKTRPRNQLNTDNLIDVTITKNGSETTSRIRIATLNARSVKNKDQAITEELNNKNVNIAVLTETWLKDNTEDQAWLNKSDFKQGNYDTLTHNRTSDKKEEGLQ